MTPLGCASSLQAGEATNDKASATRCMRKAKRKCGAQRRNHSPAMNGAHLEARTTGCHGATAHFKTGGRGQGVAMRNFGTTTPLVADGVIGQNKGRRPRRFPLQRGSTAHGMNVTGYTRRLVTIACVLGLGLTLGSCGGGFSGYVADHWPRWAGGMPSDVPPRPGAPGYDEFIAHGQADQMPPKSAAASPAAANAAPNQKPAAGAAQPVFQQVPAAPAAAANDQPAEDSSVVKGGGLY